MRALLRAAVHPVQRSLNRRSSTLPIAAPAPRGHARAVAAMAAPPPPPDAPNHPDVVCVYVTCPDAPSTDKVIDAVVPTRLAACVNVLPGITSVYRWKGEIQRDSEALLIMKTLRARLPDLTAAVIAAHPYETPEVLALPAVGGSAAYLKWVAEEASGGGGGGGGGEK